LDGKSTLKNRALKNEWHQKKRAPSEESSINDQTVNRGTVSRKKSSG